MTDDKPVDARAGPRSDGAAASGTDAPSGGLTPDELFVQRDLLQKIFENVPVLLALFDARRRRFTFNRHTEEVLGWSTEEANACDILAEVYPDPEYRAEVVEYITTLVPGFSEFTSTAKDGRLVPIEWANVRLADETTLGIGVDLRQRRRTEELLRLSAAAVEEGDRTLAALMEHVPEGITIADASGRIRMVSRYGKELLGGSHAGRTIAEVASEWAVYEPDGVTPMANHDLPLVRALRGEVVHDIEIVEVTARGEKLPLLCNAAPIRDADGGISGGIVVWHDNTARKRAEEVLRDTNELLEQRVQERTKELARRAEQLRLLASELTLAEQRERRRLAQVLHDDLQQLLAGAKYRLAPLSRAGDEAVRRIALLVQDLLDDSIEMSRSLTAELSPPILHKAGLLAALQWLVVWMQERHGLAVDLEVSEEAAPEAEEVGVVLFQSVRELLFNTAKHSGVTRARVTLRRKGDHIELVVSDEGAGFDVAAIGLDAGGEGFGLFSIRERLELLGGSLEIDSAPGHGSLFRIEAPFGMPSTIRVG